MIQEDLSLVKSEAVEVPKLYIYIAGPYSKGDVGENVFQAVHAAFIVADRGHEYYLPHNTHLEHIIQPRPYEFWLAHDMEWLRKCTALLRLDGDSSGADKEVTEAERLDLPVFYSVFDIPKIN